MPGVRLFAVDRNATLATNMRTHLHLLCTYLLAGCLVVGMRLPSSAQSSSTPLPPQRAPLGPNDAPGAQGSKMTPTGLAANGGSMAHDVYTNSTYGFSLKVPPGWAVVPPKDAPIASKSVDATLSKAAQLNRTLLIVTENFPMKKSYERKSIQIVATHLLQPPTAGTAQDYLNYSKKNAKEKGMPVEYLGDPKEVTIGGHKLARINLNESTSGVVQHIEQYVVTLSGSLIQFMLVSPDEKGLKDLEPSIQSLEFKEAAQKPSAKKTTRKKKPAPDQP